VGVVKKQTGFEPRRLTVEEERMEAQDVPLVAASSVLLSNNIDMLKPKYKNDY
jgi:hypothetical protein